MKTIRQKVQSFGDLYAILLLAGLSIGFVVLAVVQGILAGDMAMLGLGSVSAIISISLLLSEIRKGNERAYELF